MTEPSGMAGLALLLQLKDKIKNKNSKIIIVNTGTTKFNKCIDDLNNRKIQCTWRDLVFK
jgi:threonine dehydratase